MTTRAESAEDLSPVCGDDPAPHPHVSPGEYDLLCTGQKLERIRMYGGAWKCRLEFRIMAIDAPKSFKDLKWNNEQITLDNGDGGIATPHIIAVAMANGGIWNYSMQALAMSGSRTAPVPPIAQPAKPR